jgi:hypothetical protein
VDVETLAVTRIAGLVARCPHLKPVISTNDKTVFTDGHIEVYQGLGQTKAEWRGRVPVQVKGRTGRLGKGKLPKHPISRDDLRAYQLESGVLFFYVVVDGKTGKTAPFYHLLSPFAIESILRAMPKGKAQIPVKMRAVPTDVEAFERLVKLALMTRAQNPSTGFDPILFEKAESFTLHAATAINFDEPQVLVPGVTDFALVLNTSDGMSIPLDGEFHVLPSSYQEQTLEIATSSGAFKYDTAVSKRVSEADVHVRISEGLELSFHREDGVLSAGVHLTLERTLPGRLKTLGFFTSLIDTKVLSIGGKAVPIEITQDGDDDWIRRHLEYLRWLTELLEQLEVDTTLIEPDQIDEHQYRQLKVLHRAFVKGEEVTNKTASTSRVLQKVGQWHLMFLLTPGSAPDKWVCVDPFSAEQRWQFQWAAGEKGEQETMPATAYDVVEDEHLGTVVNSRLGDIVGAYEAISDFKTTFTAANHRVLALILAADECEERKDELLGAATLLNDWLLAEDVEVTHHQINAWQITARTSGLTREQRTKIRELKREVVRRGAENALQAEIACAILLEDAEEVEVLLPQLDDVQLELMKTWPIWKLRPVPKPTDVEGAPAIA